MTALAPLFDTAIVRYIVSGSLLTVYLGFDLAARFRRPRVAAKPPRWLHPLVIVSVTAFYALIGPTGGALGGGVLNVAGVALVLGAGALRFSPAVRYPDLAGRGLVYVALPLAVGVPWGWAVLSLPACLASVVCCLRAERAEGRPAPGGARYRMVPGIW